MSQEQGVRVTFQDDGQRKEIEHNVMDGTL